MKISVGEEVYAILVSGDPKDATEWFGESFQPLQVSRMNYKAGKEFKAHKHILNPRIIKRTQEAFVVIKGKIAVEISDDNHVNLGVLIAEAGEAILIYKGYHLVRIMEDTVCYEIKSGQYSYVSEDKEFK